MRMVSGFIAHHTHIELRSLGILALLAFMGIVALPGDDSIGHGVRSFRGIRPKSVLEAVRHIMLVTSVIRIHTHRAIKVQIGVMACHEETVDRYLVQIDTDTVVLSIAIEEHAELKQWVRAVFDTRDHAAWRERGLLDVAVEVFRVLVQYQLVELVHWILLARPDLRHVEGVEAKLVGIGFLGIHDLDVSLPCSFFATFDGISELSL